MLQNHSPVHFQQLASLLHLHFTIWPIIIVPIKLIVIINISNQSKVLIADLCVYDVWQSQSKVLLDIRFDDTDVESYCVCTPHAVLYLAPTEKKQK